MTDEDWSDETVPKTGFRLISIGLSLTLNLKPAKGRTERATEIGSEYN